VRPPAAAALLAILLAGCGGSGEGLTPAAEPARSPALEERPAGRVVALGGKPEGLAFDPRTGLLAIALRDPDRLALVDGRQPHDAARARGRTFVGDERGHTLSVVEHGRRERVLDAPVGPGGVAATTGRDLVGVVGVRERALELFDTATLRSAGKVDVGIGPTHVVGAGARFFVVDTRGDGLLEVRTSPLRVHRRTHLQGAPYGITLDRERRRFWVTLTATNRVAELTDRRLLRTFPSVRQPNSVAVDPRSGRVFVASRRDGVLQLLDPPPYRGEPGM
jgi:DNA-binding beta-propeller fold protein YncE